MLVLKRRLSESLVIGSGENAVVVSVQRILGQQVVIGIEAPPYVSVHRKEVYEAIRREEQRED